MPNYNQRLQTNNSSLEEIITQLNNMPDAGENSNPVLQDKTVTPTTSTQTVTADSGYDGLDTVTVNAMPTATQATPTISVSSSGLITASATQTAGYVSAGTKSATKQLTTQGAKTVTPSIYSQTVVAKDRYTTGAVTVAAIPSTYVKPTTTKSATTYTPTTSNQTISAGTYCSGAQTIKGDSNLVAENIKSGTSIFGVTGTYEGEAGSGGASVETCTVTVVQQWGGNDDPALLRVYVFSYDIETGSVVKELMQSDEDFQSEHLITFKAYKNYPIIVFTDSIDSGQHVTTTVNGGSIIYSQQEDSIAGVVFHWCMPTSDNAIFTFASP